MPLNSIDHVVIAVTDLDAAVAGYERLLDRKPNRRNTHPGYGTATADFFLNNSFIQLIAAEGTGPYASVITQHLERRGEGLIGVAFGTESADLLALEWRKAGLESVSSMEGESRPDEGDGTRWRNLTLPTKNTRGIICFAVEHYGGLSDRRPLPSGGAEGAAISGLDHVVVNVPDADEAIALYRDKLGIRLALDRNAPQWGARMLFFRLGGVTLEVIQRLGEDKPSKYASFGGMALQATDIPAAQARLAKAGVDVSEVRKGRKPGTLVATVRDGTCGVPVLLIGQDPDADPA